jgi:hypothetical protein
MLASVPTEAVEAGAFSLSPQPGSKSPSEGSFEQIHRDPLPVGYSPVPKEALGRVNGGLYVGQPGILANQAGCWHVRIRNPSRRYGGARWLWQAEIDPSAPGRFRRRAWRSATGTEVPSGCQLGTSCGDPHCISPYHLAISARPLSPPQAPKAGWWEWFEEEDEETGEVVESCEWIEGTPPEPMEAKDWSRILIRPKRLKRPRRTPEERAAAAVATQEQRLRRQAEKQARAEERQALRAQRNAARDAERQARQVEAQRHREEREQAKQRAKAEQQELRHELQRLRQQAKEREQEQQRLHREQQREAKEREQGLLRLIRQAQAKPNPAPTGIGRGHGRKARGEAAGNVKITEDDVRAIRGSTEGRNALAKRYGISPTAIYKIRTRRHWKHVPD